MQWFDASSCATNQPRESQKRDKEKPTPRICHVRPFRITIVNQHGHEVNEGRLIFEAMSNLKK